MQRARRVIQYIIGLFVMALGIVLVKKAGIGVTPVSAVASVLSDIFPISFGIMLIFFQCACLVVMLIVMGKVTVKALMTLPIAIAFGFINDFYMALLPIEGWPIWACYVLCLAGIVVLALGIVLITGADLMLPPPDALIRTVSSKYNWPLSHVKFAGDAVYVGIAAIIEFSYFHFLTSVWIGTALSVAFTGFMVGRFGKWFPGLKMEKREQS